jgi:hypothetical protein
MVAVPEAIPVRIPDEEPIAAMEVLVLLHVPPGVASESGVDEPIHSDAMPVIWACDSNEMHIAMQRSKGNFAFIIAAERDSGFFICCGDK